jgi:hypothetical protein
MRNDTITQGEGPGDGDQSIIFKQVSMAQQSEWCGHTSAKNIIYPFPPEPNQ